LKPGTSSKVAADGPFEAVLGKTRRTEFWRGKGKPEARSSPPGAPSLLGSSLLREKRTDTECRSPASNDRLQWGHGDGAVEESARAQGPRRSITGFNGATAMEPWKSTGSSASVTGLNTLQWGHGDGAVEELDLVGRGGRVVRASMGPRRWSRGRVDSRLGLDLVSCGFNGATA